VSHDSTIAAAEGAISKILAQLEADTGQLVSAIGVAAFDVTGVADTREQHLMRVIIDMQRVPGHRW
jgi:hypothetical protein